LCGISSARFSVDSNSPHFSGSISGVSCSRLGDCTARRRRSDGGAIHRRSSGIVSSRPTKETLPGWSFCALQRGYEQSGLIDGVEITGSSKMHELIKAGAATLSF
jgi:hypothetical protein